MLKRNTNIKSTKKKKGQSTVEYIILVTAIVAALIIFLRPGGVFQNAFNVSLNTGSTGMLDLSNRIGSSRPVAP